MENKKIKSAAFNCRNYYFAFRNRDAYCFEVGDDLIKIVIVGGRN